VCTQERFVLLVEPDSGAQAWAERGLESVHRGFGERSAAVSVEAFPVRFAEESDSFDGSVSFVRAGVVAHDRSGPRWGNQSQFAFAHGSITTTPVIGAVAYDFPGGTEVSRSQEGIEGLRVVGLARSNETGDNQRRGRIDADMDLAVGAPLLAVDCGKPGIGATDLKCARAGIEFVETEESFTSKTDHLAREEMGPKPEGYRWLGSRSTRGCFRSSMGIVLQADVNGCIGIGRKAGGEQWLNDLIGRLGSSPGTRLVPRKLHVNGRHAPAQSPGVRMPHPRGLSSRAWISTKVALAKAGLVPGLQGVAPATHKPQVFPKAA
jgi:hypothetical protein